jgi:drug/metabolite transporter (DMT)-like permease
MKSKKIWLLFAFITTAFWGVWGAFIETPEKAGFPATLGYSVWAVTMIPGAIFALSLIKWKLDLDFKPAILAIISGLLGCSGQLLLFQALRTGPAYLVFPFVSLSPVVTILLSYWLLQERVTSRCWIGIVLALIAIVLLSYIKPDNSNLKGYSWFIISLLVALMWGVQAFLLRFTNNIMKAESIVVYTTLTALLLIPLALLMTDFSQDINWGFKGPYLAAMIQSLNAIGFLCLVYAFRYGKAIIVSPMVNAVAPVITVVLSVIIYQVIPHPIVITGLVFAIAAAFLMAIEPEEKSGGV